MSLTVTVNKTIIAILNDNNCKVDKTIDLNSTAGFSALDLTGTQHWEPGHPVSIVDSSLGRVFSGYVDSVDETNLYPNPGIVSAVSCVGTRYLADKRYWSGQEFENRLAGDIATEFMSLLSQEGVTAQFCKDHDSSYADFSTGTLSNCAPSMDQEGCLELAPAGESINAIFTPGGAGQFGIGGGSQSNGVITCASMNAIQYIADNVISGLNNAYIYTKIWAGSHTLVTGDFLQYDVWINNTSPAIQACVDFSCSDGTTYHNLPVTTYATWDNQHLSGLPSTNLAGLADNKWYSRRIGLNVSPLIGKTITSISLAFGANQTGHYIAYFRRINIVNINGVNVVPIFNDTSTALPQLPQFIGASGYTNMQCNVVTAYESGATLSDINRLNMSSVGIYNNSLINWKADIPDNCSILATIALDASGNVNGDSQAVYLDAENNAPIPGLIPGMSLNNLGLSWFVFFSNNGPDPTVSPVLHSFSIQINPSYQAVKNDFKYKVKTDSDYAAGTLNNLKEASLVLQMNGIQANFINGIPGVTAFGASNPAFFLNNRTVALQSDTSNDARLRLDFAGTWQNGIIEVDIQVPVTSAQTGIVYRCVNWGNGNNTFSYCCVLTATALVLGYGNNSTSSSNGTFTTLTTATLALNAGDYHRLKVIFNGTSHSCYIDDVQYISITDATYSAPGYVGLRYVNATGTAGQITGFYNFGVASALSGTWVSPAFSLASVGTVLAAYTRTQGAGDSSQSSMLTEISYDGGSTWNACNAPPIMTTNSGSWTYDCEIIPGLAPGTSTASLTNCKLRLTLSVSSVAAHLETHGTLFYVISSYSGTGQRLSRPLAISGVSRIGSASLSWDGVAPANTNIQVETSLDGINWHLAGSGPSGSVSIAGFNLQTDPLIDSFDRISTSDYLNIAAPGGGVNATWYYDTPNSRLQVTGGNNALYINQALSINDGFIVADLDYATGAGLVLHYGIDNTTGQIRYYYAVLNDSAAGNTVQLWKMDYFSSTVHLSQLGTTTAINFPHNTPHRFVFAYLAGTLSLSMDGAQILSAFDASNPITSGLTGLYNNSGNSEFYQFYVQGLGDLLINPSFLSTRVTLLSSDPTQTPQLSDLAISIRSGNINDGPIIPTTSYSTLSGSENTIAQDLDDMATQGNMIWWIGDDFALNFQNKLGSPAPWIATGDKMIASTIKVSNIQSGYRNVKWLKNGTDNIEKLETLIGDGQSTSWDLGYPIQSINSMFLDGYEVTFAPKGQTGSMFYYEQGKNSITADPSTPLLGGLDKLVVDYIGQVQILIQMRHFKSKSARAALEGTSGAVELVQDASGMNKLSALQFGYGLLEEFTQTGKQLQFTTMQSGLAPAQLLTAFLPQYNLLDTPLVITDVSITWIKTVQNGVPILQPFFAVTAVEGAIVGDWTRLFTRLGKT